MSTFNFESKFDGDVVDDIYVSYLFLNCPFEWSCGSICYCHKPKGVAPSRQDHKEMQRLLHDRSSLEIELTLSHIKSWMVELSTSPNGNYLIQTLLNGCNLEPLHKFVLTSDMDSLIRDPYGSRVIQHISERHNGAHCPVILDQVKENFLELSTHARANYAMQSICANMGDEGMEELIRIASKHSIFLAMDRHGAYVLQSILNNVGANPTWRKRSSTTIVATPPATACYVDDYDYTSSSPRSSSLGASYLPQPKEASEDRDSPWMSPCQTEPDPSMIPADSGNDDIKVAEVSSCDGLFGKKDALGTMLESLISLGVELIVHKHGNYSAQAMIPCLNDEEQMKFVSVVCTNFLECVECASGSRVVERILEIANDMSRDAIIQTMIDMSPKEFRMFQRVPSSYFVIQKALLVSSKKQKRALMNRLQ